MNTPTPPVIDGVRILSDDVVFLNRQLEIELAGSSADQGRLQYQARVIHTLQEMIRAYQCQNRRLVAGLGLDQPESMEAFRIWSSAHESIRRCDEQIDTIRDYTQDELGV